VPLAQTVGGDEVISEAEVDKALRYLRESAPDAASARANAKYLDAYLKTLKATLKMKMTGVSNAAAEDYALGSAEYRQALDGYRVAVEQDALHTFKREAADALIRAWQTESATARAEGRAYGNG
jgi:hypothetical protein